MSATRAHVNQTFHAGTERRLNMIEAINEALDVSMQRDDDVVVMGEDVGYFGGVFRARRAAGEIRQDPGLRHADQSNAASSPWRWGWGPMACARCLKSSSPITFIPVSTS